MTYQIRTTDGRFVLIRTETGEGLTRVIHEETPAKEVDMEASDE